ncbi:MAG: bifunctional transaldolase/phosoglucose isomerase [Candidatus Binataceae bacterium]
MAKPQNPLRQLESFGQSVWLDYIRRHLLSSVEFRHLIDDDGLDGMTSNPTIFEKAIAGSSDYDEQFAELAKAGKSLDEIYEALTMADIRVAADALRPIYERTKGVTGYVSYEVSPVLANDTDGTIVAARRYIKMIDRANLMIKVPSTPAGIPAIEQLISEGHNINITLMFSMKHYEAVAEAYIRGLERRVKAGHPVDRIGSVASVFVSRIETLVDKKLEAILKRKPDEAVAALRGKGAVANTKLIYQRFKEIFRGERFKEMAQKGAHVQRPLWASTGTKNAAYSDVKYVAELIGPETVNTMPPATMDAFRDHGVARATVEERLDEARDSVKRLAAAGIDLIAVGEELQKEGVDAFAKSFEDLMAVIKGRAEASKAGATDRETISAPNFKDQIAAMSAKLDKDEFPSKLWRKDPALWKKDEAHAKIIRNALGWLTVPSLMEERVEDLKAFAAEVKADGIRDAVLLGMGGSSLCPELFARTFDSAAGYPHLHVLDTTVPEAIAALDNRIDLAHTLFIVSSKSGGTLETLSHFKRYFNLINERGVANPGQHFIAITDQGTGLEKIARDHKFRRTFLNPPDIGGRYSALSYFGLVPAALIGIDVAKLLDGAIEMAHSSAGCIRTEHNAGVSLGAALGALYKSGRNKITFIVSPPIAAFGLWAEQLIAESTGKEGAGFVPICDEPLTSVSNYGDDRIFVYMRTRSGDDAQDRFAEALEKAQLPLIRIGVGDKLELGQEFMRWEIATATAGAILGIDAFDQPNVQESKDNTDRLLKEFETNHKLPDDAPLAASGEMALYAGGSARDALGSAKDLASCIRAFAGLKKAGDYFAIMAYVAPSHAVEDEIAAIRLAIIEKLKIATTFGYGPRFLHSTGQLHKGGPSSGLFLQITRDHRETIAIPRVPYGFAILNEAQYLGDFQSLVNHGRRVIRVHLRGDAAGGLKSLREAITGAL